MTNAVMTKSYKEKALEILKQTEGETISFGISDGYVPNWKEKEALREYVANAYDENGTNFIIKHFENGIIVEDESERGIKLQDLVIGNSNSREASYKIGTHGEGFKIGALALARLGKVVYIETIGNTIVFFLEYDKELKSNVLKAKVVPNNRTIGSSIYLETEKLAEIKKMFLFLNEDLQKVNDLIYINKNGMKNQIFVNTLAGQDIHSFFSYSLRKKQKINRDRNIIESPYHDIAIELLNSTDKNMLRTWLSCLAEEKFENSFEFEIIKYISRSLQKKDFKKVNFKLIQDLIKEMGLFYVGPVTDPYVRQALRYTEPNKKLIFSGSNDLFRLSEKIFKNLFYVGDLNYGIKIDNLYHVPVIDFYQIKNTTQENFVELLLYLKNATLLKSVEVEEDKITFQLKSLTKVNVIKGKTSQRNNSIRNVFKSINRLLNDKVKVEGWKVTNKHSNKFPTLIFEEIPSKIIFSVNDEKITNSLKNNVLFNNSKQILKGVVYKLKGDKQYIFDSNYKLEKEIQAFYSYSSNSKRTREEVLSNITVIKSIFKLAQEGKLSQYPYEIELLKQATDDLRRGAISSWIVNQLKTNAKKSFKEIFGAKTVISSSVQANKKAKYNGYFLFNHNNVVENYCKELEIALASSVIGTDTKGKEIIEKPQSCTWKTYKESPYKKVLVAMVILQRTLENIYEVVPHNDKKSFFLKDVLPFSRNNDLRDISMDSTNSLNNSNYKKSIKNYCFEIFDRTHLVEKFTDTKTQGLYSFGTIFIKNSSRILGTFFHEYIHFSTNLKDIDSNFEKMLAFVGIMANKHKNVTEKDLENFLKDYKKWVGGK